MKSTAGAIVKRIVVASPNTSIRDECVSVADTGSQIMVVVHKHIIRRPCPGTDQQQAEEEQDFAHCILEGKYYGETVELGSVRHLEA